MDSSVSGHVRGLCVLRTWRTYACRNEFASGCDSYDVGEAMTDKAPTPLSDAQIASIRDAVSRDVELDAASVNGVLSDLLATITTIQSQLREANASCAIVVGDLYAHFALTKSFGSTEERDAHRDNYLQKVLPPAARALLDEVEGLRKDVNFWRNFAESNNGEATVLFDRLKAAEAALRELKK